MVAKFLAKILKNVSVIKLSTYCISVPVFSQTHYICTEKDNNELS